MSITIDFTPQEEAWLAAESASQGVRPEGLIKQMIDERMSPRTAARRPAVDSKTGAQPMDTVVDAEQAAVVALLNSYIESESTDDPDEIRKAVEELEEFKRNMNANRAATSERLVYP